MSRYLQGRLNLKGLSTMMTVQLAFAYLFVTVLYVHQVSQADFLVFLRASRADLAGMSPYPPLHSSAIYSGSSFVYPYLVSWLFLPFTVFSRHTAEMAFTLLSVSSLIVGLRALNVRRIGDIFAVLTSTVMIVSIQMGTLGPLLFLGLALTWRYRKQPIVSGVILALVAVTKLYLAPLLAFPLFIRRYGTLFASLVISTLFLAGGWMLGPLSLSRDRAMLFTLARHEGPSSWAASDLLRRLGLAMTPSILLTFTLVVFVTGASIWAYRTSGRQEPLFGGLIAVSLLLTPILWSSYLPVLLVAVLILSPKSIYLRLIGLGSWIELTPDRAGLLGVGAGISLSTALVILELRRCDHRVIIQRAQAQLQCLRNSLRARDQLSRAFLVALVLMAILTVVTVVIFVVPGDLAAIVAQLSIVATVGAAILWARRNPLPEMNAGAPHNQNSPA